MKIIKKLKVSFIGTDEEIVSEKASDVKWSIPKILVRKDGLALKLERMNALAFLWKLLTPGVF